MVAAGRMEVPLPVAFKRCSPESKRTICTRLEWQAQSPALCSSRTELGHGNQPPQGRHARCDREAEGDREAIADALAVVQAFNARLPAGKTNWAWPTIGAALATRHHWLVIACGTVTDLDLSMKPRDPNASIHVALRNVRCPRCNGNGVPRITALSTLPST